MFHLSFETPRLSECVVIPARRCGTENRSAVGLIILARRRARHSNLQSCASPKEMNGVGATARLALVCDTVQGEGHAAQREGAGPSA